MSTRHTVEAGYDHMAEQYLATKNTADPTTLAGLEELVRGLPPGGTALDLGCGAGVPTLQWLAERFTVTGVDISARQLELARCHVPAATLVKADMGELDLPDSSFDVVVAFYSIIHLSRTEQPALVRRIFTWLKPGGRFLATWAMRAGEDEEENWEGWGAPMWWSHFGADDNLALLQDAGFRILNAEPRTSGGETWLWVLANKR